MSTTLIPSLSNPVNRSLNVRRSTFQPKVLVTCKNLSCEVTEDCVAPFTVGPFNDLRTVGQKDH